MDAVGRDWPGAANERPLTELGGRQAQRIADELEQEPVHALYASSNVRCRQSLEPLAKKFGLKIVDAPNFADVLDLRGQGPNPMASAYLAGSASSELEKIRSATSEGRVVICSNGGDIVSSLMAFLAGSSGAPMPEKRQESVRGAVYKAVFDGDRVTVSQREASPDFPS